MLIRDDFLRKKTGWWTVVRRSTRTPYDSALYMYKELMNAIENAMQSASGQRSRLVM